MRYFIAFMVALGLLFLVIVLLLHSGSGGGKAKIPLTPRTLDSYASTDAEVSLTIDGPINAAQNHVQIRVTAGRDDVNFEQIQGYDGTVVNHQSYANTQNAYTNFLLALAHAGFTEGNNNSKTRDERGLCPLGDRYIFQLKQDGHTLERYWATSCGNPKTYLGALQLTLSLFQAQVPSYNILTQNVIL